MFLYIDPGTGSMLLSLFIGIATAAVFGIRALAIKLQFIFTGGKLDKRQNLNRIPYVIYSDHKRYWNVFKPICDEFEKRGADLVFFTSSPDDPALSCKYNHVKCEYIGEGSKAFMKLNVLKADIVISTTPGLDVYQWKRSKDVKFYVHIPHSADELASYRMFGMDYYDAVLTSGKNQVDCIRTLESLRLGIKRKDLTTVGSIPLDNLKYQLEHSPITEPNSNTTVLLAPSWGPSGLLARYGEKLIQALINTGFDIIVRPHPQTVVSEQNILKPLTDKFSNVSWNYDNDNFEVLRKSDILITDFSGIILDYACVFDKPVIYADTKFDTMPYDADWLDEPKWSFKISPEIGIQLKEEDLPNIKSLIEEALSSEKLQNGRDDVRRQCWKHIGESAKNTVDYLLKKEKELTSTSETSIKSQA